MAQIPTARGLFLCDQVIVEEGTRHLTLVNCFRAKGVVHDPPEPFPFVIVAFLNDGLGDLKLEVVGTRLDLSTEVLRLESQVRLTDRLREFRLRLLVDGFAFPSPGEYEVVLLADGELIAQAGLTLFRRTT